MKRPKLKYNAQFLLYLNILEERKKHADDWLHFLDYLNAVVNLLKDKNNQTDEFI